MISCSDGNTLTLTPNRAPPASPHVRLSPAALIRTSSASMTTSDVTPVPSPPSLPRPSTISPPPPRRPVPREHTPSFPRCPAHPPPSHAQPRLSLDALFYSNIFWVQGCSLSHLDIVPTYCIDGRVRFAYFP
ncbi:hypothetical protein E2C01_096422 [Portunus trituberculatus]|uniref:Uncharacterized protein n=1 Tax=Portunus trituberculatus TaxID=210409 RepID=A0A5B7K2Y3_PORTR|nr:hypothetical protein [Portunus trituberculatus]